MSASTKATATPTTSSRPKLLTIGVGESIRARKPAIVAMQAVAIVEPAAATVRATACAPRAPLPTSSSKRAWNWIA